MPDLAAAPALPVTPTVAAPQGRDPGLIARVEPAPLALVQPFRGRWADVAQRLPALGGPVAPEVPTGAQGETFALLWAGPEGWLAVGADAAALCAALDGGAAVAEQSDARFVLALRGDGVRDVLARGVDIDLHPRVFAPGAVALTRMRQIGVILWRRDTDFVLIAPRPTAADLWRWLARAGAAQGLRLIP